MKMNTVTTGIPLVAVLLLASLGYWTITQAVGTTITACVNKSGEVYVIGQGFRKAKCDKNETLLSWNITGPQGLKGDTGIQGPKGDKGDKGDQGLSAQHGAGNIVFIYNDLLLKTDGTIWRSSSPTFTQVDYGNGVGSVPLPVSDIVAWEYSRLLDKDGNYWYFNEGGNVRSVGGWQNLGPLP